ncbi:MAG: hypothetical protein AB7U63_17820 [Porticoccaceae bacterium]
MKPMSRSDLFTIAERHGIKTNRTQALAKLRQYLLDYYRSPEGQAEISAAPRIIVEPGNVFPLQDQNVEVIVDLLLQEVEGYYGNKSRPTPGKSP